jgi:hypothetical protein
MAIYTVHEPPQKAEGFAPDPDRFVFVRDGFSFWAFLLAPLWMLRHRLWLVLLGYVLLAVALQVALGLVGMSATVMTAVAVLLALLVGFEAASLRRFTLARRRWTNIGIVVGDDAESAERRFFDAWVDKAWVDKAWVDKGWVGQASVTGSWAGSAPPASSPPVLAGQVMRRPPASPEVIGLFPEPGASR